MTAPGSMQKSIAAPSRRPAQHLARRLSQHLVGLGSVAGSAGDNKVVAGVGAAPRAWHDCARGRGARGRWVRSAEWRGPHTGWGERPACAKQSATHACARARSRRSHRGRPWPRWARAAQSSDICAEACQGDEECMAWEARTWAGDGTSTPAAPPLPLLPGAGDRASTHPSTTVQWLTRRRSTRSRGCP